MIISVCNQKGGVSKTTTTCNLASGLVAKGYKVLCLDLDQQCNLTYCLGADETKPSILDLIVKRLDITETLQKCNNIFVIKGDSKLNIITSMNQEINLKTLLEPVIRKYDYILIDTPPSLNILTMKSLMVSDKVIIPCNADGFSLQGIQDLYANIIEIQKSSNKKLKIDGILLTSFNERTILSKEIAELMKQLAKKIGTRLYKTRIRESIVVKESIIKQIPIIEYKPENNVAKDYKAFVKEFIGK